MDIYGSGMIGLKERSTRRRPEPIGAMSNIPLPPDILDRHKDTIILMYYTFIHGLPYLYSASRGYTFRIIEYIPKKIPTKKDSVKGTKR